MDNKLRAAKYGYLVLSVLLCVLGMILIVVPDFSLAVLCRICGILLTAFGVSRLLGYIFRGSYRSDFGLDLVLGIMQAVLGLVLIFQADTMVSLICILLGIYILADSLFRIRTAFHTKAYGLGSWWLILTAAVITAVFGIILLFRPQEGSAAIMMLLGIAILVEGIQCLISVLSVSKILKDTEQQKLDDFHDFDLWFW